MKDNIIALIDCDSFFVSCEQALNEDLKSKPVCVISGERGCVLARSTEAKEMGIPMGIPYFMAKKEFPEAIYITGEHSNYKDFSRKVMSILRDFSPTVEIYSIDEAFVELSGLKTLYKSNYLQIAQTIRKKIQDEVKINVSIGVSKSKVLAKLACEKAKPNKGKGVYLIGKRKIPKILKTTRIEEIWGIGRKTTIALNRWGILTCDELINKSDEWINTRIGKRGLELKHELLGECIDKVKNKRKPPQSIQNTRSFPEFTSDLNYIKNALNIHIHNSCTKLRYYNGKCRIVGVMLRTKDFKVFYDKKKLEDLANFELEVSKTAMKILEKLYNPDIIYRSCGIVLDGIDYTNESQLSLFIEKKSKDFDKLAIAIDKLEAKFGRNVVKTGFTKE